MDSMAEIKQTFFQECEDLLDELEAGLLFINEGYGDDETINAVFRAVHSIKGGAGAFGLEALVRFAHIFETTLDEIRAGRLEATQDVLRVLLKSSDILADLVRAAQADEEVEKSSYEPLIEELEVLAGKSSDEEEEEIDFEPVMLDFGLGDDDDAEEDSGNTFSITFKPNKDLYINANETALILRALASMGEISIECDTSVLPSLDELDPEGAYLTWNIELKTTDTEDVIHEIFEFVDGDCELTIEAAAAEAPDILAAFEAPSDDNSDDELPDLETLIASVTGDDEGETPNAAPEVANVEATAEPAAEEQPKTAEIKQLPTQPKKEAPAATIRVNLDRVDRMINLVGELVITQAMLSQCVTEAGLARASSVASGLDEFKQLTREIQESVMAIRAQPVKSLFQRMSRVVREAGDATGKSVRLITEGETTEVDKTVVEKLAEPLTHMIRNAVDHGLESPEDRAESGKSEMGTVRLTASHRSGRIVIDISDDGSGINRKRVKQIAIDKELIPADAQLSNSEIDNLLFMPGFSTAKEVSDLSGRGVGMDVVKRAIQALGGKISISSEPGKGSTFSISLPLTLAILDGMVVTVADQTLVIPLTAIVETLKPSEADIHPLGPDANVISIRGEFIPIVDIGMHLGYREQPGDCENGVVLSVETDDGARSALLVDGIQDQRQVVIKSLEENYGNVPGIAAATILGDGRIALILDVDGIVARAGGGSFHEPQLAAVG